MKVRISAWAIRNPIPVAILFIALTLSGIFAYSQLPIKQNPNVVLPIVVVNVTQSGAAASQMETQVTRPIEDALASLTNVKHITSRVNLGSSTTTIEFELGTDMQKVTDDVRTSVDRTRVILPPGIDPPNVQRIDLDSQAILTYVVQAPSMSPVALSWFVDDTVARALQTQPGVAQVNRLGGADREINVTLDPARMAAFGVTAPQVNTALYAFNVNESGGRSQIGEQEQTVRVLGEAGTVDTLRRLMVPAAGRYVTLADIADIGDGQGEARGFARLDNAPVVGFEVQKTTGASDVAVEARVKLGIAALEKSNAGVKFDLIQSSVEDTRESFTATTHVLIEGMVLAAFVVFLFLKSWRATAIAAIAMPLSLIPTFAVIHLMGFNLDQITLLSLTLVIGILVDDAIVEIENIEKRIERGETPYRAALIGADSIGLAVVATTATIVAVFTPVSFMPGIAGEFFKEFGLTVSTSVLFSLVVARLLTPLLAAYFLKPRLHTTPPKPLGGFYRTVLDGALRHRWISVGVGGLIFIASLALMASRPVGFEPAGNPDFLSLSLEGPPGATRAFMENAVAELTQGLRHQSDVSQVFAQVGTANDPGNTADLRNGSVLVILKRDRAHRFGEIRKLIRPLLRQIPDVRISSQGDQGSFDFEIVLTGQDSAALDRTQFELEQEMSTLPGVSDIHPAPPPAGPELVVTPRPDEAARLGVTSDALASVLRIATIGDIDANVAKFSSGERRIPIRVRLADSARSNLSTIETLQVPTANGKSTPLSSVATLSFAAGPNKILRYNRQRRVSVQANLNGVSLGTALKQVHGLPIMRHLPKGISQPETGDAEILSEVMTGFMGAILAGMGLIFAVMILLFRSFFKPIVILAALPLSLLGAAVALMLCGMEIDMPVFIGLLMLFGIAAKNSILLVEFAIEDERSGQSRWEALHNACRERARPIVMTTIAMIAGMLPTAIGLGRGSEFRQPMAVAVIGGLVSSTAFSLVLVPVIYMIVDAFEQWLKPRFAGVVTPRQPGDDAPIREGEETLVTHGA